MGHSDGSITGFDSESVEGALRALSPDGPDRHLAARLVKRSRRPLPQEFTPQLHSLLTDPAINPRRIERAGWLLLLGAGKIPADTPEATARWLEQDDFALALLSQSHVTVRKVEDALTAMRRWLLLSDSAAEFPRCVAALRRQAELNAGAWMISPEERAVLAGKPAALHAAYHPERPSPPAPQTYADPTTREVAAQYDGWPYPAWVRATAGKGESFAQAIAAIAPDAPKDMPEDARMLIAGCGTGLQAMNWAQRFPRLKIVAIDISVTALAYAEARRPPELSNLSFQRCDIHDAKALGTFDVVITTGVLHHLPDPEAGWAALTQQLRSGGVMRVMLYSKLARLPVQACRALVADLASGRIDEDVLREARARLMARAPNDVTRSPDFFHLGGVYDLLLHRHEDAFDVPRIQRAIAMLELRLLRVLLPHGAAARYRRARPDDPYCRDFASWAAFERDNPTTFGGMYDFWCLK